MLAIDTEQEKDGKRGERPQREEKRVKEEGEERKKGMGERGMT